MAEPAAPGSTRPEPREGQRRQVTVLFADVVGFTSLSERLDAEAIHELMDGCFVLLTREVDRYGGTINAFTGDGVMALFGAPLAEQDHATRALPAALHIQESLRHYEQTVQRRFGVPFQMRIGVNTRVVVAGAIGDRHGVEYTALGDTINLAARLEKAAPAGGILAGESTHRAAREALRGSPSARFISRAKLNPFLPGNLWRPAIVRAASRCWPTGASPTLSAATLNSKH